LDSDAWIDDVGTPVFIAASDSMARAQQERIVRFLQRGGRTLIAPLLPRLDEALFPCTVLADFIGAPSWHRSREAVTRVAVWGRRRTTNVLKNDLFYADPLPSGAEVCAVDETTGRSVAWQVSTENGGSLVVLGLAWDHRKHEQSEMLLALSKRLGLKRRVTCTNPSIWTALLHTRDRGLLFLINLFTAPMQAEISYIAINGSHVDLGPQSVAPMSVQTLEVIP
ncbi:MAG: hypothetical protein MUF84_19385, partial [Anaerolineae bacterium]|nr:hypothetical protein [Anaerolineae bacterium]